MNRNESRRTAILLALMMLILAGNLPAFIQFVPERIPGVIPVVSGNSASPNVAALIRQLEQITGLELELNDSYLRVQEPKRLPLLYAGSGMRDVVRPTYSDRHWSPTARQLLLSALHSSNVYKVRENKAADLGRVDYDQTIELDFTDFDNIVYRSMPKEAFDAGMIFLHELVHRHLRLTDPTVEQIKKNPKVKGDTVEFLNRIERELGLPERRHYAPVKIRFIREDPRYGIYFGNNVDRVEFDSKFVMR